MAVKILKNIHREGVKELWQEKKEGLQRASKSFKIKIFMRMFLFLSTFVNGNISIVTKRIITRG